MHALQWYALEVFEVPCILVANAHQYQGTHVFPGLKLLLGHGFHGNGNIRTLLIVAHIKCLLDFFPFFTSENNSRVYVAQWDLSIVATV